jgi:hypothetical protein
MTRQTVLGAAVLLLAPLAQGRAYVGETLAQVKARIDPASITREEALPDQGYQLLWKQGGFFIEATFDGGVVIEEQFSRWGPSLDLSPTDVQALLRQEASPEAWKRVDSSGAKFFNSVTRVSAAYFEITNGTGGKIHYLDVTN